MLQSKDCSFWRAKRNITTNQHDALPSQRPGELTARSSQPPDKNGAVTIKKLWFNVVYWNLYKPWKNADKLPIQGLTRYFVLVYYLVVKYPGILLASPENLPKIWMNFHRWGNKRIRFLDTSDKVNIYIYVVIYMYIHVYIYMIIYVCIYIYMWVSREKNIGYL